ncbi:RNA polymerase sigma factor [Stenotrophomonas sp. MMGLT7]|uniref:RNA polymerase sigma factor n=1 Tax=Stenotrophomonas sp. MMGLT7 TaxID=2901227 RepID=UPI001E361043|nr:RNA polymerase sigma factor [Stenotrophomonas sp. MMGLT7]MCD7097023.1 RNA polymerase sigma factor [Stenotrophomonas sp. MMGLT7]
MSPNAVALVELLIRERNALFRFLGRYLDPASSEDTLQNMYLKASAVPGDPPIEDTRGYLYRMAYHHALNRSQAEGRERRLLADAAVLDELPGLDGEQVGIAQAQLREIAQTILGLPEPVRRAFVLNRYLGLSEREIAARMGISKSLVARHVLRAARIIQHRHCP